MQHSRSKRARRNPSPRMIKVTVQKRKVNKKTTLQQPTHNHDSAAPRQHPAHVHWCGAQADPPSSWPTHVAGRRGDPPKQDYISAILAGILKGSICAATFKSWLRTLRLLARQECPFGEVSRSLQIFVDFTRIHQFPKRKQKLSRPYPKNKLRKGAGVLPEFD